MVFKKVLAKNKKTSGRLEYRFSSTVNISFFCPFTMVYFLILLFIFSAQFFYKSKHFLITKEKGIICKKKREYVQNFVSRVTQLSKQTYAVE
jgi:hypothetical protein